MHSIEISNPRDLPGFRKKSFALPFGGGEIWFEHLDGIYEYEELVLEKLSGDIPIFCRPSKTSVIGFVLDETVVTDKICSAIVNALINTAKRFTRVCFIGSDKKTAKRLKKELFAHGFAVSFINDFEKAKEWLISETF